MLRKFLYKDDVDNAMENHVRWGIALIWYFAIEQKIKSNILILFFREFNVKIADIMPTRNAQKKYQKIVLAKFHK